ncbi:MAG: hypothetical protein WAL50_14790 [Kineosporiaceae bacterium]
MTERVIGPTVLGPGFAAHIHVGIPTIPTLPAPGSGTIPIVIARNCIAAIARRANTTGSGPTGTAADQNVTAFVPAANGLRHM